VWGRHACHAGRCGLCFRNAVFGCASGLPAENELPSDSPAISSSDTGACVLPRTKSNGSAVFLHRGAPRWCSRHRRGKHATLLAPTCAFVDSNGAACGRAAAMANASAVSLWKSQHVAWGGGGPVRLGRVQRPSALGPWVVGGGGEEEEEEEAKFPVPELCVKHSRQLQTSVVGSCIAMADAEQLWRTHLRPYLLFRRAMEANVKGNGSSDMCKVVHGGLRGQHGLEKVWRYSKCHYSEGCLRAPSFGFAGQRGRYCSLHRQANHTNLKNKLCRFAGGCSTAASFGPPRQRAVTCAKHRLPSHIDLRNRLRCKEAGCDRRARYKSVASLPADLCSKHRKGAGPQSKSKADGEQGAEGGSTDEGAGNLSGVREPVDVCETPPPAVD
jgi:hypothetical protein